MMYDHDLLNYKNHCPKVTSLIWRTTFKKPTKDTKNPIISKLRNGCG